MSQSNRLQRVNLDPATACQFTVPASINYARRKTLDKFLRRSAPLQYLGMKGSSLYFNFANSEDRDEFLIELETMVSRYGNQTERIN